MDEGAVFEIEKRILLVAHVFDAVVNVIAGDRVNGRNIM